MFQLLVAYLHMVAAIGAGASSVPVDHGLDTGQHLIVSYLNNAGLRHTGTSEQLRFLARRKHPVTHEVFQIVAHNNTCVSLLLMRKLKSARRSCHEALHLAKLNLRDSSGGMSFDERSALLATVHSTLGIMEAMMGAESNALRNFQEACRLDSGFEAARHNLEILRIGVAQVSYAM